MPTKSVVTVPLYVYPLTAETWAPLHQAISSSSDLHFLIILNPNSGPGRPPWWPNIDYVREIPKLTAHDNVTTVGYVRIDYCKRDLKKVQEDVDVYAGWKADLSIPGCYVNGIFFDETPNEYSTEKTRYLEAVTRYVKGMDELGQKLVILNPGCMPDYRLKNITPRPDFTVVWEESHARLIKQRPPIDHQDRTQHCVMLHSVQSEHVVAVTRTVQQFARYVFVTNRRDGFYEHFGESWSHFIAAMKEDTCNGYPGGLGSRNQEVLSSSGTSLA